MTTGTLDSEAVQQTREDLAACLQMATGLRPEDGICTHFSAMVAGAPGLSLVNPWLCLRQGPCVPPAHLQPGRCRGGGIGPGKPEPMVFFTYARPHKFGPRTAATFQVPMPKVTALSMTEGEPLA